MLIACPNCKTRYDVDPGPGGETKKFRCSNCRAVFGLTRKPQGQPAGQVPAPAAPAPAPAKTPAPAAQPAPPAASAPAPAAARPAAPSAPVPEAPVAATRVGKLKVVIANESAAFCEAVRKVLASEPFEIFICNDGKVALETVERVNPELLFLDVALPTMFGFEVCERVRQNPALSGVKIVLIASIYDKTRYKRSPNSLYGADDYIEKHHIPDQLVPMIYRLAAVNASMDNPSPSELAAQEETRAEIREVEVRETSAQPEPSAASPSPAAPQLAQQALPAQQESAPVPAAVPPEEVEAPAAPVESAPVQAPAAPAAPEAPEAPAAQLPESHVKAKRLARIIVSDIVLYNQGKVEQGVRDGNLYQLLADDIKEGERLYRQRVPEEVRESTSFLKDAFEDLIVKKRAELRV